MHPLLRSVWDEPRPPDPPPRAWWDWTIVAALMASALIEGLLRPELPWRGLSVIITIALAPTLLWRRTRPLLMVAIAFGLQGPIPLLTSGHLPEMNTMVFLLALPYALFRWGSGRDAVIGSVIIIGKIASSLLFDSFDRNDALGGFVVLFMAMAVGEALRYRAKARVRELDQAKLLERERLARDLHDTVAHHVSAIAIRAQAGLATAALHPDAATEALHLIEAEASRTLTEMRAMVRVLRRDEPAELAPSPRVTDLEQLASHPRDGPSVDVDLVGDLEHLPPSVGAAVYRVAQESVTNARRHARHATRIQVRIAADDTLIRLRISDDGDLATGRPPGSPGYGLVGMIERVNLLGGTCEAGPGADRGWTVTAELPRTGWAT